ncbi:MAG: hypothetical protein ACLFWG_00740 [Longimicrobiales bacterium]
MSRPPTGVPSDRRGFALMLVVFLLFAIGVAAAAGYQVVNTEGSMALTDEQGSQAFTAAQGGLERFMSEHRSSLPVEVTYTLPMDPNQDVRAVVSPTLLWNGPLPNRTYRLTSVGTFVDPRFPGSAAERTVSVLAEHRLTLVRLHAALVSPSTDITINDLSQYGIDGRDTATSSECSYGGSVSVRGVAGGGSISITPGNSVAGEPGTGGPPRSVSYGSPDAVLDSLDVAWDAITSPGFPMEHEDEWPDFGSIPADSFPVIRWNGDLQNATQVGRGLLIITGEFDPDPGFEWDGIVIAHDIDQVNDGEQWTVRGMLVVGMDGSGDAITFEDDIEIKFHSCNVARAGAGLAHLVPLAGTWWEQF